MRPLFAVLVLAACGRPAVVDDAAPASALVSEVTLTLESRDGSGTQGWSFAAGDLVPVSASDLHVSSFDCGARGRWVTLEAADGVQLCAAAGCGRSLSAGGSDGAFHEDFEVRRGDTVLAKARIVRETETPRDWYVATPMPPFHVVLSLR